MIERELAGEEQEQRRQACKVMTVGRSAQNARASIHVAGIPRTAGSASWEKPVHESTCSLARSPLTD